MVVPFIEHYVANREVPLLWPPAGGDHSYRAELGWGWSPGIGRGTPSSSL